MTRLTRRGRILARLGAFLGAGVLALTATGWADPAEASGGYSCPNKTARILHHAGFRGHDHRVAWAIVMRESRGQNLDESSPWYTGALGIWQVQTSAWSGKHWWSRSAMLNPRTQSRIVYRYMSKRGTYFAHWGLTRDGRLDATFYAGWTPAQWEAWIMRPFRHFYAQYPCR